MNDGLNPFSCSSFRVLLLCMIALPKAVKIYLRLFKNLNTWTALAVIKCCKLCFVSCDSWMYIVGINLFQDANSRLRVTTFKIRVAPGNKNKKTASKHATYILKIAIYPNSNLFANGPNLNKLTAVNFTLEENVAIYLNVWACLP